MFGDIIVTAFLLALGGMLVFALIKKKISLSWLGAITGGIIFGAGLLASSASLMIVGSTIIGGAIILEAASSL